MATSCSLPVDHFMLEHCVQFLQSRNSAEQMEHPSISRYKTFITSGPDTELLRFQSSLLDHDVRKILIYLRNFKICDLTDYERIANDRLSPTSDLMVAQLVQMIWTKDPHAFWYFIHSVKTYRGRNGLFEFFHGNINCCVCEEVEAKEKEIHVDEISSSSLVPYPFGGARTTFTPQIKWSSIAKKILNSAKQKATEEVKNRIQKIEGCLNDFRQEIGPPIQELKESIKGFAIKKFGGNDPCLSAARKRNSKETREENQPLAEVVIPIPIEQSEQLEEVCECSCSENENKPVVGDEEAGYKRPTKRKSKCKVNCKPSLSTFDVVEGRKKYIAFVFACLTLYQYVDSLIKFVSI